MSGFGLSGFGLSLIIAGRQKGGLVKGWFWRMYPRSGFRSGGTCERTLVLVFVSWEHPNVPSFRFFSGLQKGPAERGHVKKRQKSSKSVKKFFDTFRQFSRRAKNVKYRQKVSKIFRHFSTIFRAAPFFRPLLGASEFSFRGNIRQNHPFGKQPFWQPPILACPQDANNGLPVVADNGLPVVHMCWCT